ncbi:MAG: Rha family transcriptional regulator [Marinobacterium sp.]|nr:Rha family transcriptional regulator [Marinobacterium sp.]
MATTPTQTASAELNPLDLISIDNNSATTTSFKVAKVFGKQHKDVLRKLERLECSSEFTERNFTLCFKNNELQNGKPQPYYKMTQNGFAILAMGFTGTKAMKFKEDFLAAFDWMAEQLLLKQQSPSTPSDPPIDTTGPHWMQIDGKPVITFKLIEQLTGHSVGQLTYVYHKNKARFAESCWILSTSQPGFQQLKDQGQGGNLVRLFNVEGYQLLMQLFRDEYQPRLEAEQAELLPAPEAASEQQLFQIQGIIPFYADLSGVDLPYPAVRHEQPGSKVEDLGDERLETYIDVFDEALRDKARCDGLQYKTICHYLLKGLATRDSRLQVSAMGTLFAMREPLGLGKVTNHK